MDIISVLHFNCHNLSVLNKVEGSVMTVHPWSVAICQNAGKTDQQIGCIAIGPNAGKTDQGAFSVAIGKNAGNTGQKPFGVAIGNLCRFFETRNVLYRNRVQCRVQ